MNLRAAVLNDPADASTAPPPGPPRDAIRARGGTGVKTIGEVNRDCGPEAIGLRHVAGVSWNLEAPRLYEEALRRGEAELARGGALVATTGGHTGRSPKDKPARRRCTTSCPATPRRSRAPSGD